MGLLLISTNDSGTILNTPMGVGFFVILIVLTGRFFCDSEGAVAEGSSATVLISFNF